MNNVKQIISQQINDVILTHQFHHHRTAWSMLSPKVNVRITSVNLHFIRVAIYCNNPDFKPEYSINETIKGNKN